ncbi:MAG: cryptochrome/photolyase family protein, partial [Mucilaginibacter polytrichastri]|nr:cryptochrome/photolyase family protein [Mucilaginibacter polytrichastri]
MAQKTLRLILGDQLNLQHSWFHKADDSVLYVLMEVKQEQDYVKHHIQKIVGFFAAMRNFATQLERKGHKVIYLKLDDAHNEQTIGGNLNKLILSHKISRFEYQLPDEYRLGEQLKAFCEKTDIESASADTEHFYTNRSDVGDFFDGKKQFVMENFYRQMRVDHGILMNGKSPAGGQWNFDKRNRQKYDGKSPLEEPRVFQHDVSSLKEMVDKMSISYFGEID